MSFSKIFGNLFNQSSGDTIITVDSQHGSGAVHINKIISQKLNIELYDEDIIELKTLESKIDVDNVSKEDSFLKGTVYDLYKENYSYSQEDILENDANFLANAKTIRQLASKGPCIIVGKCGNYILKEREKILSVFITADYEYRISDIMKRENIDRQRAITQIRKIDTRRSNHYKRYASGVWGQSSEYDLTIDSTRFSAEDVADIIIQASKCIKK
jgi:cytidylate kinase